MILVCPITANTLGKVAYGISDTPVTAICTVALGSKTPIVMVPSMHDSMFRNPIVQENIQKLTDLKVTFLGPRLEENKAKIASTEEVVDYVVDFLGTKKTLVGKKFLITAGASREMIDRVRFISNPSTGKMGMAFGEEILAQGGEVTIIAGKFSVDTPVGSKFIEVTSADDFVEVITTEIQVNHYDVLISAAALADFTPIKKEEKKISSNNAAMQINLKSTPKLIKKARELQKDLFILAFKAETDLEGDALIDKAYSRLKDADTDLIVANNVHQDNTGRGFASDTNEVYVIDKTKKVSHLQLASKRIIAAQILDIVAKKLEK